MKLELIELTEILHPLPRQDLTDFSFSFSERTTRKKENYCQSRDLFAILSDSDRYQKSNDKLNSINKVNSIVCFLLCSSLDWRGLGKSERRESRAKKTIRNWMEKKDEQGIQRRLDAA